MVLTLAPFCKKRATRGRILLLIVLQRARFVNMRISVLLALRGIAMAVWPFGSILARGARSGAWTLAQLSKN